VNKSAFINHLKKTGLSQRGFGVRMFRKFNIAILSLFSLIFFAGCAGTVPKKEPPLIKPSTEVIKHLNNSTAALVLTSEDRVHVFCTAVWVSQKTLLTAHHCVEGAAEQWSEDHQEDFPPPLKEFKMHYIVQGEVEGVGEEPSGIHLASVALLDKKHDLALLKAEGSVIPPHEVAEVAKQSPAIGEKVYVLGHVKGLYWSLIEGVVSAYRSDVPTRDLGIHGPFIQISGPVFYGNSGGGAFNTQGELVGIASFMYRAPQTTMFVQLESIKNFLKKK